MHHVLQIALTQDNPPDDSWYYLCQGFVLLGREMYLLGLFNRTKFVEIIGKGRYGSQTNIMKELYIIDHVLERLSEPLKPIDYDLKYIKKIRSEVDAWINKNSELFVEKKTKKINNFKTMDKWFKTEK